MPKVNKLSVIIPCFNEEDYVEQAISEIFKAKLGDTKLEVIMVDDGSTDSTLQILRKLAKKYPATKLLRQKKNRGKGAAVKVGILSSTGDAVVIQDADLEYSPQEFPRLLEPLENGRADAVYGSRFVTGNYRRQFYYRRQFANKFLTKLSNLFSGLKLTDMETCQKIMRGDLARAIAKDLQSKRFGLEPEITAKLAKKPAKVVEVGISYYGRSKAQGKKIGLRDGLRTIWEIIYFNKLT